MGYDFRPRKKDAGPYHLGAFVWPWMLREGLGLVLGSGEGFRPAEFVYLVRPDGLCVQYNDGARVTAKECGELAKVARWIADIQGARIISWNRIGEAERQRLRDDQTGIYKLPWAEEAVERFRRFADWCDKARGFTIH